MFCDNCGFFVKDVTTTHISQRPKVIYQQLCHVCRMKRIVAATQVHTHNIRARKLGLLAALTLDEWMDTKAHFDYRCAYCGSENAPDLDHFIPSCLGGDTAKWNCVPACESCNIKKKNRHPAVVKNIPQEALEFVRRYLMTFQKS